MQQQKQKQKTMKNMDINEIFKMMQKSGTVGKDFTSQDIQQFVQQMMSHVGGDSQQYDTNKIYSFINNANNYNNQNREAAAAGGQQVNFTEEGDDDEEDFVDDDCEDDEGDEYGIQDDGEYDDDENS